MISMGGSIEYDLTDHKPVFAIAKRRRNDFSCETEEAFIFNSYRLTNEACHYRF